MAQDDFGAAIGGMVRELGLPDRFFSDVFNEDDWSFVIKGHALLEAAATHVLVKISNDEALRKVYARLEMSNKDTGKLAFMTSFNVLGKSERRFIMWFSQIRNLVVHNISHVNFSFSKYVASLPADKKKEFIKAVSISDSSTEQREDRDRMNAELATEQPKVVVLLAILWCLARMYEALDFAAIKREAELLRARKEGMLEFRNALLGPARA